MSRSPETYRCARCPFRSHAERKPATLFARLWRWHTRWCPGWKSYQRSLAEHAEHPQRADS